MHICLPGSIVVAAFTVGDPLDAGGDGVVVWWPDGRHAQLDAGDLADGSARRLAHAVDVDPYCMDTSMGSFHILLASWACME